MPKPQTHAPQPRQTAKGTPAANTWDDEWLAKVDLVEQGWQRRICGAKTPAGAPCTLESRHPSGRCPHHGGHELIGAPAGNANARVHGMYSRRITTCGNHCPMWESCPFAKKTIMKIPAPERPKCVYEQAEFDMLTENLDPTDAQFHLDHMIALMQVMASRAAHALAHAPAQIHTGPHDTPRLSPIQQAFFRLAQEHQRYLKLKYTTRDAALQQGVRERMYGEKVQGYWAAVEASRLQELDAQARPQKRNGEDEGQRRIPRCEGALRNEPERRNKAEGFEEVDAAGIDGADGLERVERQESTETHDVPTWDGGAAVDEADCAIAAEPEATYSARRAADRPSGETESERPSMAALLGQTETEFASLMASASLQATAEAMRVAGLVDRARHGRRGSSRNRRKAVLRE